MPETTRPGGVNEKAGLLALLALGAALAATAIINRLDRPPEDALEVYLDLSDLADQPVRLRQGAEVRMVNHVIGQVERVELVPIQERLPDGGGVELPALRARLRISGDFTRYVGPDSEALIKKTFGLAGSHYVEIVPSRMTTQERASVGPPRELAVRVVDELASVDETVSGINELVETLRVAVTEGDGLVPRLLSDKALANEVLETIVALRESIREVNKTLVTVNESTRDIPSIIQTVGSEVKDLSGLVLQTQLLLHEITKTVEGMQRHWLLRSAFEDGEPEDWLSPAEIGSDVVSP